MLQSEGAEVLARYDHHFFGRFPALTRNAHGRGTVTYEGTVLSDALQEKVVRDVLARAGLTGLDQDLPPSVRLRQGMGRGGKMLRYYLNFSREPQSFGYPHAPGADLLTGHRHRHRPAGDPRPLGPGDHRGGLSGSSFGDTILIFRGAPRPERTGPIRPPG